MKSIKTAAAAQFIINFSCLKERKFVMSTKDMDVVVVTKKPKSSSE